MHDQEFLSVEAHFDTLVETMPEEDREAYTRCKAVRIETAFQGRHFVIYKLRGRDPVEVDRITFSHFTCDDASGAKVIISSAETLKEMELGYTPRQIFDYPIFMFLPLHMKVRWATLPGRDGWGSLAYPVGIRTQSNRGMREPGVIHCETGVKYGREFSFDINH